ncbi:MAG: GIY-YIG nuclease family protein [Rhodospirillales bacterium]|nr:GIY-YIG nuclease family protein [Rhodospirillales bacterium]
MYVYIMTNTGNTTFYVGVTNNLARRIWEHKSNILPGFTEKYELHKLVYYECYEDETTAITREKYLKKCYRKTKEKLISEFNPMWNDLYDKISE